MQEGSVDIPNQNLPDIPQTLPTEELLKRIHEVLRIINEIGVTGIHTKFGKSPINRPAGYAQTITKFDDHRNIGNFIKNYHVFNFVHSGAPLDFGEFFRDLDSQMNDPVKVDPNRHTRVFAMKELDSQYVGERIGISRLPSRINTKKQIGVEKKFLQKPKPIFEDVAIPVNAGTELVKCPRGMGPDRICLIGYCAGGDSKFTFEGGKTDHRLGNVLRAWALVPESVALEFNKILLEDPSIAREFAESVVKDVLISRGGDPTDWDSCKTGVA